MAVFNVSGTEESAKLHEFFLMCDDYGITDEAERSNLWEAWQTGGFDYLDEVFEAYGHYCE